LTPVRSARQGADNEQLFHNPVRQGLPTNEELPDLCLTVM
jgi:hypothetical protein